MKKSFPLIAILLLSACAQGQGISLRGHIDKDTHYSDFDLCHGYSCKMTTPAYLTTQQWTSISKLFTKSITNAKTERAQISRALAKIERYVTQNTNMRPDHGKAENFETDDHQMDCIDETINTTRYLTFLEDAGFLKYHRVGRPIHRGYFLDGTWPHNSATIENIETGKLYALDTYFYDNGSPPPIVPFKIWMDEWKPEEG